MNNQRLKLNGNVEDDWKKWSMHVLKELERNDKIHDKFETKLDTIHDDLLMLKTKAAVWGSIAGAIFGLLGAILIKIYGA